MGSVVTFADGYGLWHAIVPTTGSVKAQRERARRAIATQVRVRQGDQRPVIRLDQTPPAQRDGTRTWSER